MYSVSRRDMMSMWGRFWKYSDTRINLTPVDENEPRLGGRVQATETGFDFRTFTFQSKNYHGVYGEDFLVFGEFTAEANPDDEATLLKIFDDNSSAVVDRHFFKFADQQVTYSRQVDADAKDTDVEHAIEPTQLGQNITQTWSETLFYGAGNARM